LLPDEFTLGGTVAGLILSLFLPISSPLTVLLPAVPEPWRSFLDFALAVLLLGGPLWLVARIISYWRKREALGLGDLKLILLIASFLGLEGSIRALLIGSVAGVLGGVLMIRLARHDYRSYELPLGSFFCLGAAAAPFLNGWLP
jgi:leader peptidase (prepilin peptidase) / N-methyltransferase